MAEISVATSIKHLEPSKLGTKEYWDQSYQNDIENVYTEGEPTDLTNLESWFDVCDAPVNVLEYLTSEDFPLSPNNPEKTIEQPTVLDLGCGNGSSLFELKLEGGYPGQMVGIDYSQGSIDLSRKLWTKYIQEQQDDDTHKLNDIAFETFDLMEHEPSQQSWWQPGGFDLVMDKGTFDAIALSSQTVLVGEKEVRICETYPQQAAKMVKHGGYLIITSCNWTEAEVIQWFTQGLGVNGVLEEYGRVKYQVFEFGGKKGQAVASVCFRRVGPSGV